MSGGGAASRAARWALPLGLAAAVLGMAAVAASVVIRGIFMPGVIALTAGLAAIAVAGALRAFDPARA